MLDEFKKHWFIGYILVAVAVAGTTWAVLEKVVVGPREFAIQQLQREIEEVNSEIKALKAEANELRSAAVAPGQIPETRLVYDDGVEERSSATTTDGRLVVKVKYVFQTQITLTTALGSGNAVDHDIGVGERITVVDGVRVYYVDAWRTRGNLVDLKIFVSAK